MIVLPRQARDKHRESTQKKSVFGFLAGFKLLEEKKVSAVAVVNDEGQLVGEMDSNSLKMIGNAENEYKPPLFLAPFYHR